MMAASDVGGTGLDPTAEAAVIYETLLGRRPDRGTAEHFAAMGSAAAVAGAITGSQEYQVRNRPGPLWQFTTTFDPVAVALAYENPDRRPMPGHRVNYLGVAVNVRKFIPGLDVADGVEGPPLPANWHADLAEFAAALRAVDLSGPQFAMAELGCGWGCWMNITGAAARSRGKELRLIGIEGDEGHLQFAREALATNGFSSEDYRLVRGIAAGGAGVALFPNQAAAGGSWGLEPVFGASEAQIAEARSRGTHDELKMTPMAELLGDLDRLDLLHIDIQGGETALIRDGLDTLNEKVAYIVVGTHSRVIDGELIDTLTKAGGWTLEMERPCLYTIDNGQLTTRIDGVQGWRNTRFDPR